MRTVTAVLGGAALFAAGTLVGAAGGARSAAPAAVSRGEARASRRPPSSDTTRAPEGAAALRQCAATLKRREVELRVVQAAAASRRVRTDPLEMPEPGLEAPVPTEDDALAPTGTSDPADPDSEQMRAVELRTAIGASLAVNLGLTDEETAALTDMICPMRSNRRALFQDRADGRISDEELWQEVQAERQVSQEGLRQVLGEERNRTFRELGGVGIFAQTHCPRGE